MNRNALLSFVAVTSLALSAGHPPTAGAETGPGADLGSRAAVVVADTKLFRLYNPFPFPLEVKVLGNAPSFPQVVMTPAAGYSVPIPYPDLSMRIQIRKPTGGWTPPLTVKWRSTGTVLPNF